MCCFVIHLSVGTEDGLAQKPPMGYNSWNDLECRPSEEKLTAPCPEMNRKAAGASSEGKEEEQLLPTPAIS